MTRRVDYDDVAPAYDGRYARSDFAGTARAVLAFATARPAVDVLEVGCGTGHWLAALQGVAARVLGLDPSAEMLARARASAERASIVRGRAESLPWRAASVDRVVCVNALHHFDDTATFFAEARRVLRSGGGLLTIGLDPHTGLDQWWVYDHFPSALAADRARYLATAEIRRLMTAAGFARCETAVAQHSPASRTVRAARAEGILDRRSTSQLMVIDDAEYEAGLKRILALAPAPGDAEPTIRADLRLYATTGWVAGA